MSRAVPFDAAAGGHERPHAHTTHRVRTTLWVVVLVLLALVVLARWVVSPIATSMVNRKLGQLDGFHGHVAALKIALWRGGVQANQFELFENGKEQHGPIVQFEKVDLRLAWPALFQGKLGGQMTILKPQVDIQKTQEVKTEDKNKAEEKLKQLQMKMDPWQVALRKALPIELSRLEVVDGTIHFSDTSKQPVAEFAMKDLHVVMTGLRNRAEGDRLPAKMDVNATLSGNGSLRVHAEADPMAKVPRFTTNMNIQHLDLTGMNAFLGAYSKVNVTKGTFEFYLEAKADNGSYDGYVKPFFKDLDFKSADNSLGTKVKEAAAEVANAVLKNKDDKKVATKAPFSGTFSGSNVDVWTAIDLLLRNAFVQALREGFDH